MTSDNSQTAVSIEEIDLDLGVWTMASTEARPLFLVPIFRLLARKLVSAPSHPTDSFLSKMQGGDAESATAGRSHHMIGPLASSEVVVRRRQYSALIGPSDS